jgi:hypothetical protein
MSYAALFAGAVLCFAMALVKTPRSFQVRCIPDPAPSLDCTTTERSFWGARQSEDVTITARTPEAFEIHLHFAKPPSLRDVNVYMRRPPVDGSGCFQVKASIGDTSGSLFSLCASRRPTKEELAAFRDGLRSGETRTLDYRTEWSGFSSAWALVAFALFIVWVASGRTRVRFDLSTGRVDVESQPAFFAKWQKQGFARDDIVEVLVSGSQAGNAVHVYRPAFHLKNGEIVPLGISGHSNAKRAQHWAHQLELLLAQGE